MALSVQPFTLTRPTSVSKSGHSLYEVKEDQYSHNSCRRAPAAMNSVRTLLGFLGAQFEVLRLR